MVKDKVVIVMGATGGVLDLLSCTNCYSKELRSMLDQDP